MPHIQIEHSSNIKYKIDYILFNNLITILTKLANVKPENCKCKVFKIKKYYLGSNSKKEGFINLNIKIIEARSKKIINQIGAESLHALQLFFQPYTKDISIQYSIEIQEIKSSNYFTTNSI